jgi:hypothetical protein
MQVVRIETYFPKNSDKLLSNLLFTTGKNKLEVSRQVTNSQANEDQAQ